LATSGCFQGTGKKANGVDIARVINNYPTDDLRIDLNAIDGLLPETKQALAAQSEGRTSTKAKRVLDEMRRLTTLLAANLGSIFDKRDLSESLKRLEEMLGEDGAWNTQDIGISRNAFRTLCDDFASAPIKDALGLVSRADVDPNDEPKGQLIGRVAQLSFTPVLLAERFIEASAKVIASATAHATTLESQVQGMDVSTLIGLLESSFSSLTADISSVINGGA
jgi:hypothetical protein